MRDELATIATFWSPVEANLAKGPKRGAKVEAEPEGDNDAEVQEEAA